MKRAFAAATAILLIATTPALAQLAGPQTSLPTVGATSPVQGLTANGNVPDATAPVANTANPAAPVSEAPTGAPVGNFAGDASVSAPSAAAPHSYPICKTRSQDSCRVSGRLAR